MTTFVYSRPDFNETWPHRLRYAVVHEPSTRSFSVYDRKMFYVVMTTRHYDDAADHAEFLEWEQDQPVSVAKPGIDFAV